MSDVWPHAVTLAFAAGLHYASKVVVHFAVLGLGRKPAMGPASSVRLRVRRLGAIAALLTVASLIATPTAIASVSVRAPGRALRAAPASQKTLAQAPKALQAAVRATLGPRSTLAGPSQQAELTPSDGAAKEFGWSVAISGPPAVVGAPACFGGCPGGVYVFVRSGPTWS